jgi:hypothetical protein
MLVPFLFGACTSTKTKQPYVPAFNNAALTTTLQRGVSSAADVKKALGEPEGSGGFLFPTDTELRTVWFYEKVKVVITGQPDIQQDVLLVFFKEERFDGFLWFSDAQKKW